MTQIERLLVGLSVPPSRLDTHIQEWADLGLDTDEIYKNRLDLFIKNNGLGGATQEELIIHLEAAQAEELPVKTDTEVLVEANELKIEEALMYLASTDFKMTSDYDQDVTDILPLRQEARDLIRLLQS